MLSTLSCKMLDAINGLVIYICKWGIEGYQQQPIAITQCLMGSTQSPDGSTIQYYNIYLF